MRTQTPGEGFLVLTVTRCRGWSATIDGNTTPIHAVDGPLMGVRVPAGEHIWSALRFRPVLAWAGMAVALSALAVPGSAAWCWRFAGRLPSLWNALRRCAGLPE